MPLVCGHRGASGHAPENTLVAFRKARELGATWIEFDVQLSADGVPVVFHDNTLERTTSLKQPTRPDELNLNELKALDAGSWFRPEFTGEKIPTLEEVLQEFGQILSLNIELKSTPGYKADDGLERKVADLLDRYNLRDRVLVSSFDPFRLMALHGYAPDIRLGGLYEEDAAQKFPGFDPFLMVQSFEGVAIHPPHKLVDEALVRKARQLNLAINTWTVNELPDMQRLVDLGIDMLITNYPDRLAALLAGKQGS